MFDQPRKSLTLQVLENLNQRKTLKHSEVTKLQRLKKGYQGEIVFANALKKYLDPTHYKIFDLNLSMDGTVSQYDVLLLMKDNLLHFEVKNQSGDYYIKDGNWHYLLTNQQINNPLHQASRANRLLNDFLRLHHIKLEVNSFTVFVHPQFYLYYAPIDRKVIFPSQIKHFLENINQTAPKNYTHPDIYKLLTESHIEKLPHEVLPEYTYEELKKDVFCDGCLRNLYSKTNKFITCHSCNKTFTIKEVIEKSAIEFSILFPDEPITINKIHLWTNQSFNKKTIAKHLNSFLIHIPNGKFGYYKF